MSKAAKISIFILIALLLLTFGLSIFILLDKQKTETRVSNLQQDLSGYQDREKGYILDMKNLKETEEKVKSANEALKVELEKFQEIDLEALEQKLQTLTQERNEWQKKVVEIRAERDQVLAQLEETREELQEKEADALALVKVDQGQAETPTIPEPGEAFDEQSESYWAKVLKERAKLEVKAEDLNRQLDQAHIQITELQKENTGLQLAFTELQRVKEGFERNIQQGQDLADSLSLQLARAQNDKGFLSERIEKITRENESLRSHIKELTTTKLALEKSIVRMQGEKKEVEKRLSKTETVIQERIDDIWQLKENLDETMQEDAESSREGKDGIELSPIVVSSNKEDGGALIPAVEGTRRTFDANVVSVNSENNFVIIDAGAAAGLKLGDALNVYRDADFIAGLKIIQVRHDIAAADITNRSANIQVGDIVR